MGHRNRFAWSAAATAAIALTLAFAPRGEAGQHGTTSSGSRSSSSGHSSSGHSSGHVSSSSSGHSSSGHTTSPAPPRSSWGGHYSGGHYSGGHYYGGGSYGGRYYGGHHHGGGGWYPNWYWGYWPYWASFGWWWGSPWYGDWSDWRFAYPYGYHTAYYGDVYAWRAGGWPSHFGRVKTDVEPDEAQVLLNGKYVGTADDFDGYPDYIYFEPGTYHLEFQLPGYQTLASDVTIHRGETVRINHRLEKAPGQPRLGEFLPESKGVPMGRYFGKDGQPVSPNARHPRARAQERESDADDETPAGIDDRNGRSDGQVQMDSDDEEVRAPEPRHTAPPPPPPATASARGRLRWTVTPDDAAIWVDDEYLGTGEELSARPRGTVLGAGHHTVTVVRPGYRTRTVEVEVAAGEAKDLEVELEK